MENNMKVLYRGAIGGGPIYKLTMGSIYDVHVECPNWYAIKNDIGAICKYRKSCFDVIKVQPVQPPVDSDSFLISDLFTGQFVEYRNGSKYLVLRDTVVGDILSGDGLYSQMDDFTSDMTNIYGRDLDIVAVYSSTLKHRVGTENQKEIWRRDERKDMSIKQIEAILGYTIKVVPESKV